MLIQCFLYYSPLWEKDIHVLLELLVVIPLQQMYKLMGHNIGETLWGFLCKLEVNVTYDYGLLSPAETTTVVKKRKLVG